MHILNNLDKAAVALEEMLMGYQSGKFVLLSEVSDWVSTMAVVIEQGLSVR